MMAGNFNEVRVDLQVRQIIGEVKHRTKQIVNIKSVTRTILLPEL